MFRRDDLRGLPCAEERGMLQQRDIGICGEGCARINVKHGCVGTIRRDGSLGSVHAQCPSQVAFHAAAATARVTQAAAARVTGRAGGLRPRKSARRPWRSSKNNETFIDYDVAQQECHNYVARRAENNNKEGCSDILIRILRLPEVNTYAPGPSPRTWVGHMPLDPVIKHRKALDILTSSGDVGAANRRLQGSRTWEVNKDTFPQLQELYPEGEKYDYPLDKAGQLPRFTTKLVGDYLSGRSDETSVGPSGWSFHHLKRLVRAYPAVLECLTIICQDIADGWLEGTGLQKEILRMRGIAFAKKGSPKPRPISISEPLLNLAKGAALRSCRVKFTAAAHEMDLGFGTSGGTEIAIHAPRRLLRENERFVVEKLDISNAYNCVDRMAIYDALVAHCPELIPLFRFLYQEPLYVEYGGEELVVKVTSGVIQGCPLSSCLFQAALIPILAKVREANPELLTISYLDDITLTGMPDEVAAATEELAESLGKIKLTMNPAKCSVWRETPLDEAEQAPFARQGIPISEHGIEVVGSPIGTAEYIHAFLEDHAKEIHDHLDAARACLLAGNRRGKEATLHGVYTLTRLCIAPRTNYMLRTIPPAYTGAYARYIDKIMVEAFWRICDHQAPLPASTHLALAHDLVLLPARLGGMGLPCNEHAAAAAYVGSIALVGRRILNERHHDATGEELRNLLGTFAGLEKAMEELRKYKHSDSVTDVLDSLAEDTVERFQRDLMEAIHRHRYGEARAALSPSEQRKLVSSTGDHASQWLTAPISYRGNRLHNAEFATLCKVRLNLPVNATLLGRDTCHRCMADLHPGEDPSFAQHALTCSGQQALVTGRHDEINKATCRFIAKHRPDLATEREPALRDDERFEPLPGADIEKRADLRVARGDGTVHLLDFTIRVPTDKNALATTKPGACAEEAEIAKTKDYARHARFPAEAFIPVAFDVWGALGPQAKDFYDSLTDGIIGTPSERNIAIQHLYQRLSVTLQRYNARILNSYYNASTRHAYLERKTRDIPRSYLGRALAESPSLLKRAE